METTPEGQKLLSTFTGKAVEAMALWADANHRILQETVTLAASTATEGLRLYTDLQASTVEAARAGRDYWLSRASDLQECQRDPAAWWQKTLLEGVEENKKVFATAERNARAVARSAEKLQAMVEQSSEKTQQTFSNLAAEVKGIYMPVER